MGNVGRIKPLTKMACPSCRRLLEDFSIDEAATGEPHACPGCGQKVRLPEELVKRAQQTLHLGRNLDITC
jgi:4-hydroxy-3-methylbut-2-en-1-yl diphosphate synthase IspG/GcpE